LAGPNGAGKSTAALPLLKETLGVSKFVNADLIAEGLSGFEPERAALAAGRVMLDRLKDLAAARATFAFETTLAGRSYAPWLRDLKEAGYSFHLVFLFLPTPEFALARVSDRVRRGGHAVPEETVRRRFHAGLKNFIALYLPLAETWRLYDNSRKPPPRLLAVGREGHTLRIEDHASWERLQKTYGGDTNVE
jgi:predicted ABC-type ATPase